MSALDFLLPWDRQPQEVVDLNPDFPAIAGFIGGFGSTLNLGVAAEPYGSFTGSTSVVGVGSSGHGVQSAGSADHGLKLHSVSNRTDTVWERPSEQVSVAVFLRRFGNTGGNSPLFGNQHPSASPFTAWGIVDAGGGGSPQFQTSGGGSYTGISSSASFGNDEDVVIVGTYDGATMRIYRNGVLTGSTAKSGAIVYPNNVNRGPTVGNFWGGFSSRSFNGIIYGGILNDRAWSPDLVIEISSPVGFWKFVRSRSIPVPVSAGGGATTHDTTGALTAAGSTVAGTAAHIAKHATSGTLAGAGSTVAGSSARTRAHPTSGALSGAGSAVAGSAARERIHTTSGTLSGGAAAIAGSAARERVHPTSGTLSGAGSTVVGSADHVVPGGTHATSGALQGAGSTVAGSAAHIAKHATSGALAGAGSAVAGTAARAAGAVTHATSGALVGQGSSIDGVASGDPSNTSTDGGYSPPKRKYVAVKRGKKFLLFNDQEEADEFLLAEAAAAENATKPRKVRRKGPKPPVAKISIDPDELGPLLKQYAPNADLARMMKAHQFEQVLQAKARALRAQDDEEAEFLLMVA